MNRLLKIGLPAILILLVGYRVMTHGSKAAVKNIDTYYREQGIPVVVQPVTRQTLTLTKNFTGTVQGTKQADVMANTSEDIVALFVSVGDRVRKGDVVAELDADIPSAMSLKYNQTKTRYEDAERNFKRMKSLLDAGAVSEQMFEKAKMQFDIAKRDLKAASKLIRVESPISGTVTHLYHKVGETVRSGSPIARVAQLDQALIEISVSEAEIAGARNGQAAQVSVSAYPDTAFAGRLESLSLSADPLTRAFTAWVRVPNRGLLLRPGMFATVRLVVATRDSALAIPAQAISKNDGEAFVYCVTAEQTAEVRPVRLGVTSGAQVEVLAGLQEGERIVVLGQNKLTGGKEVNIVETRAQTP